MTQQPPAGRPWARRALLALAVTAAAFAAVPITSAVRGTGPHKDYPLWYCVGLQVRLGHELYPADPGQPYPFLYPPAAALPLAALSHLGAGGMAVALAVGNLVAWAVAAELSARLAGATGRALAWARVLPSAVCLFFVHDMFLIGQSNLVLLALAVAGLACLRTRRPVAAGTLFGLAAAVKVFPASILVYLVWRRHWAAAAAMTGTVAGALVLAPAPVRGFDRNLGDLAKWADGVLFKRDDGGGIGQRPEHAFGWKNQSLVAVGSRLLRDLPARFEREPVSVFDLSERAAGAVILAGCVGLGLGFVLLMPRRDRRTPASAAAEHGVLLALCVVATPYALTYFLVWLIYPVAVLVTAAIDARTGRDRLLAGGPVLAAVGLMVWGAPVWGTRFGADAGAFLWATLVLAGGLAVRMRRSARPAAVAPDAAVVVTHAVVCATPRRAAVPAGS